MLNKPEISSTQLDDDYILKHHFWSGFRGAKNDLFAKIIVISLLSYSPSSNSFIFVALLFI